MEITHIDHIVLTVQNLKKTVQFYCDVLGMEKEDFGDGRVALKYGNQKINLHQMNLNPKQQTQHQAPSICALLQLLN